MTSGHSTSDPTSPVWPPPSVPWHTMKSRPASLWLMACLTDPARAPIIRPEACTSAMTSAGGVPRALAMSFTLSWRSAAASSGLPVASVQPIIPLRRWSGGGLGHAVLGQQAAGEAAVVLGHHRLELCLELHRVHLAHALVLAGDDDVDAVGIVAHVLVQPFELDLELLGGEADGAEDADAAGVGHRGHDVAAVGEGEDGELDAESVADLGVHGCLLAVVAVDGLVGLGEGRRFETPVSSGPVVTTSQAGLGAARSTMANADATSSVSRLSGSMRCWVSNPMMRARNTVARTSGGAMGSTRPSSIHAANPLVNQSCAWRDRARMAVATSGSRVARSHSSRSSSRSRRVWSLGFVTTLAATARSRSSTVAASSNSAAMTGDERVGPFVEQRQEQSLLRAEVRVDRPRGPSRRVGHGVDRDGVDAPLREQARRRRRGGGPGCPPSAPPGSAAPPLLRVRPSGPGSADPNLHSGSYLSVRAQRCGRVAHAGCSDRAHGILTAQDDGGSDARRARRTHDRSAACSGPRPSSPRTNGTST